MKGKVTKEPWAAFFSRLKMNFVSSEIVRLQTLKLKCVLK
jgi:hypothetical protein